MRPARLEINLDAITHNLQAVRDVVGPQVAVIAVVKADAYGHGALPVARACLRAGTQMLAVALVEEGLRLRREGVLAPVLVMGAVLPHQAPEIVVGGLTPAVMSLETAQALSAEAIHQGGECRVHLKVDTGMLRGGFRADELAEVLPQLAALPGLRWEGVMSHLADPTGQRDHTAAQVQAFTHAVEMAQTSLGPMPYQHLASSAALCALPECRFTAVRPGNMLYGALEGVHAQFCPLLLPAATLRAEVALLKQARAGEAVSYGCTYRPETDTMLALVPVGYGDGYPRALTGQAEVLIGGRRHPVVGRICMDSFLVDVGPEPDCRLGDEVVLLGRQGAQEITVVELAQRAGTITQEIMARFGSRLPRVYIREGDSDE